MSTDKTLPDLKETISAALRMFDYKKAKDYSVQLLGISEKEGALYYEAYGNLYNGICEMMIGDKSLAPEYFSKALELSTVIGNDTIKAMILNNLGILEMYENGNSYVAQQYFMDGLKYAKTVGLRHLQYSIYNNLSEIAVLQKDTTGLVWARELYNAEGSNKIRERYLGASNIARLYYQHGKIDLSYKYYNEAMRLADNGKLPITLTIKMLGALLLSMEEKHSAAIQQAKRVIEESSKHPIAENVMHYKDYAVILRRAGNYVASNSYLDSALNLGADSLFDVSADIWELKGANMVALGYPDEAVRSMEKADKARKAQNLLERRHMIRERGQLMELTKKEKSLEVSMIKIRHQKIAIICLIVFVLAMGGATTWIILQYRKKQELYKEIVKLNIEHSKREEALQRLSSESCSPTVAEASSEDDLNGASSEDDLNGASSEDDSNRLRDLYQKVCRLMEEERLYANPTFTREKLIERLDTNSAYLTKAISIYSGINYPQLVNRYRIEEAKKILSDPSNDGKSLSELYRDLGFGSASSFFKIFKDATGVTPAIWKKQIKRLNNN